MTKRSIEDRWNHTNGLKVTRPKKKKRRRKGTPKSNQKEKEG